MSSYHVGLIPYIPSNFVRKPGPMEDLPRWKATELRLDLLYMCPTNKQFLSENRFGHLMLLHVAIKLLVNKKDCRRNTSYAEELLKAYVSTCPILYGNQLNTFSVHSLIHLPNDVLNHGSLDEFSAFLFENKFQKIKNLIRKSGKPLQQFLNRLEEIQLAHFEGDANKSLKNSLDLLGLHSNGPLPITESILNGEQFKKLHFNDLFSHLSYQSTASFWKTTTSSLLKFFFNDERRDLNSRKTVFETRRHV